MIDSPTPGPRIPLQSSLIAFVKPLYLDIDGRSRYEEVERISRLARQLCPMDAGGAERELELLLLFQGLGDWLGKIGNFSRTVLGLGSVLEEKELRSVRDSLSRPDLPRSASEISLASARLIDGAGVRGLAFRLAGSRREGSTPDEVIRAIASETVPIPDWMPEEARVLLRERLTARDAVCRRILSESD